MIPSLHDSTEFSVWPPPGGQTSAHPHVDEVPPQPRSVESAVASAVRTAHDLGGTAHLEGPAPTAQNIWRSPHAHPLALVLMVLDAYGEEALHWDPDVLKVTLQRDGKALSNSVWNRIMAGRVLFTSPSPWRQWHVFHWVTRALCGETPNFVYLERPEVGHIIAGYDVMRIVDPLRVTSSDVDKFIAATLRDTGSMFAPAPLQFCAKELEEHQLQCGACHALHRDDHDVRCVTCGSTELTEVRPWASQIAECQKLWDQLYHLPLADSISRLPETAAGTVVHRLLVDWDYARDSRAHLLQQLKMLGSHA